MKYYLLLLTSCVMLACNNEKNTSPAAIDSLKDQQSFFPVTSYIKGQILEIRQKGLTPVKYTVQKQHTDSAMIKFEMLDTLTAEFVTPEIDSNNLTKWFKETQFLDKTINAVTFTYEPRTALPQEMNLQHWDIYIDPENGKVKRIYLIKKTAADKTLQLTWQSNKWFSIVTLANTAAGNTVVEKEEKIVWDY